MSEGTPAISVRGMSKRYGELSAVRDLDFEVAPGEVVGFLGPNGAGKTTTMRVLTGFLPPSDGSVAIAGHDVFHEPRAARRAVGYLPESPPLYREMRVRDYLAFVARIKDVPRARVGEAVDRALERCGLVEVARRILGELSKGYRQRAGLAQAIVHEPPVLVLDEPTVGLDPLQIREIRQLIAELSAPGAGEGAPRTVLLSTHIIPEVKAICRRVLIIRDGQLVLDEPMSAVEDDLEGAFARAISEERAASGQGGGKRAEAS